MSYFPAVLLQRVALVRSLAPGAHPLPPVQFCALHCHLAAPGSPWYSTHCEQGKEAFVIISKSAMMEVGEEVTPDLWQAAPAC